VHSGDPLTGASNVLAVVSLCPRAVPEENEPCRDLLYPFEPADPVTVDRTWLRIPNIDVPKLVLGRAVPGENALAPQCHFLAGPVHSGSSGERSPRGHSTGRWRQSHTLEPPGTPEGVVVHKLLPTAAYRPTLDIHFCVAGVCFL
jgi:hypothetical protein